MAWLRKPTWPNSRSPPPLTFLPFWGLILSLILRRHLRGKHFGMAIGYKLMLDKFLDAKEVITYKTVGQGRYKIYVKLGVV